MTDTRAGRVADKAIIQGGTDARSGRVALKAAVKLPPASTRTGRVATKAALQQSDTYAQAGRVALKAIIKLYIPVQVIQSYGPGNGLGFRHWPGPPVSYKVLH